MGTPEDVACEEYFTPPTLTKSLKVLGYKRDIVLAKRVFKEWLRTVGLSDYTCYGRGGVPFSATESIRKLLIILVDEP